MSARSCRTCDFYSGMHNQCRVEAPKAMVVPGDAGPQVVGMFPPIGPDGWCGRYEPDASQPSTSAARGSTLRVAN